MHADPRPGRWALPALALLAPLLLLACLPGGAGAAVPACASFASQAAAQDYFIAAGGSATHAVGRLNPDGDGVACAGLSGPYAGYATLGYNRRRRFFYGTVTMPANGSGGYACMVGNSHFPDAPRRLNVYRLEPDGVARPIFNRFGIGVAAEPGSGRLLWRADRRAVVPGRYYAEFEERQRATPYGPSECPAFRSPIVRLP